MSEFEDEYSETLDSDFRKLEGALLNDTVRLLEPGEPIQLRGEASVQDAIDRMVAEHRAAVVVVDAEGRLAGIFTERDVLFRIVDRGRNPATLRLAEVMTADPERLRVEQPLAAVLQMMSVGGFRHIPIVDGDDCALFVVSVRDVVQFLVEAFPREILTFAGAKGQRERDGA
jgi:CBS domain-containing protein